MRACFCYLILIMIMPAWAYSSDTSSDIEIFIAGEKHESFKAYRFKRFTELIQTVVDERYGKDDFFELFWQKLLDEGISGYSDDDVSAVLSAVQWPSPLDKSQRKEFVYLIEMSQMINESVQRESSTHSNIQLDKMKTIELSSQEKDTPIPE